MTQAQGSPDTREVVLAARNVAKSYGSVQALKGVNFDIHRGQVTTLFGENGAGKSTLVNRIIGRREAVVEDVPGVTRDRISYEGLWNGRRFMVQDTGGWEPDAKGLQQSVARQAEVAMQTADAILLVVDAVVGAGDRRADRELPGRGTRWPARRAPACPACGARCPPWTGCPGPRRAPATRPARTPP